MARDFHSAEGVEEWLDSLDERWPQRNEVAQHIIGRIGHLPFDAPTALELCCGGGRLGEKLLRSFPALRYSGIDFSQPLLDCAHKTLSAYTARVALIKADLNEDTWLDQIDAPVHAIFSMQSLHDLGEEAQVERIYEKSRSLLAAGGFLLNADFQHNPEDPRPGRLSAERHILLLKKHGYQRVEVASVAERFACCIGYA